MTPGTDAKPDLGVLFVHGIGEQVQGETLVHFADPLAAWLTRWLSRGAVAEPGIGRSGDEGSVVLSGTELEPRDGGPARTLMVVRAESQEGLGGRTEWLLAESWWAKTFQPPKTTTLLLWLITVLPYLLLEQWFTPLRRSARTWSASRAAGGWSSLPPALRVATFFALFLLALPLAALGELVVLLLLVPLLIPIPRLRGFAKTAAVKLSNTLGDSFVLTSSTVQFDAMVRQVAHDLAWLQSEARAVAVVAHSQGSAVAHEAIRQYGTAENLTLFATVGQGLGKLHRVRALRRAHRTAGLASAWLGVAGLYLVTALTPRVVVSFARGDVRPYSTAAWAAGVVAAAVTYGLFRRFVRDAAREEDDLLLPDDRRPERWLNYYASADPVSNGPLFSKPHEGIRELEVWNGASVLTDHTQYTKSQDDFLSCLAIALLSAIDRRSPSAGTVGALERARWRGWWRVWWLSAARLIAAVAGVVTVVRVWTHLSAIGRRISGHTPDFLRTLADDVTKPLRDLLLIGDSKNHQLVGIATVAVVLAAGFVLIAGVWRFWEAKDVERFFRRRDPEPSALGGKQFGWFVASLVLLLVVAVVVSITGDYAAEWNFVGDHPVWSLILVASLALTPILADVALRPRTARLEDALMQRFPQGQTLKP